jgi:general secretion pathway protein K
VVVIWALALLAAIAASLTSATRTAALIASNGVDNAQAEALADAGARLAILNLGRFYAAPASAPAIALDGSERSCKIASLGAVTFAIESETGKADLNTATDALLVRVLSGAGGKDLNARALVEKIADFRDSDGLRRLNGAEADDYRQAGLSHGPKDAPFDAIEELEQVLGIMPDLAVRLRPYLTVHSGATGIDPRFASRAMMRVLSDFPTASTGPVMTGPDALPSEFISFGTPMDFRIRVSAETPAGARFIREAIVEIVDAKRQRIDIRRWYRGSSAGAGAAVVAAALPPC